MSIYDDECDDECEDRIDIASDAEAAAYRAAAKQLAKAIRVPLLKACKREGASASQVKLVGQFLETERGLAVLGIFLGFAIVMLPNIGKRSSVLRMAAYLRVGGLAVFADDIAEVVGEPLRKALSSSMKHLKDLDESA